jgi:hypothetical protein
MIFEHMCANIHVFRNMSKSQREKFNFCQHFNLLDFSGLCSATSARALVGRGVGAIDGIDKDENYVKYLKSD